MCKYTTIFVIVDDFCKVYKDWEKHKLIGTGKSRQRDGLLSLSEVLSIVIFYHFSGYKNFKFYYEYEICGRLKHLFPRRPCYDRFLQIMPNLFLPLMLMFHCLQGKKTGEYYADSTHFAVCKNKRIYRHKTFEGLAARGNSTMGWFFGFKLHLIINTKGQPIAVKITGGNADDRKPFEEIINSAGLKGKCYADKGYIGQELFKRLYDKGLHLITGIRKNMKNYLMPIIDKIKLRKRFLIETVFSTLKERFNIFPAKHRSPTNFFVTLFAALIAFQIKNSRA